MFLLEYSLNVLNIEIAAHEETNPQASTLIINKLTCSLIGEAQTMHVLPATIAYQAYGIRAAAHAKRLQGVLSHGE